MRSEGITFEPNAKKLDKYLGSRGLKAERIVINRMGKAVGTWHGKAQTYAPIGASFAGLGKLRRRRMVAGRKYIGGSLRKGLRPVVATRAGQVLGIIYSPTKSRGKFYGVFVEMGTKWTRKGKQMGIAGGRVRDWRPGDPPITDWAAKRKYTTARMSRLSIMPFIRHFRPAARKQLEEGLLQEITE